MQSVQIKNERASRLPELISGSRIRAEEKPVVELVDDYSPMPPARKLTFPNSRSESERKRHASLHIEPNENY